MQTRASPEHRSTPTLFARKSCLKSAPHLAARPARSRSQDDIKPRLCDWDTDPVGSKFMEVFMMFVTSLLFFLIIRFFVW